MGFQLYSVICQKLKSRALPTEYTEKHGKRAKIKGKKSKVKGESFKVFLVEFFRFQGGRGPRGAGIDIRRCR